MGIGRETKLKPAIFFDRDGVLNAAIIRDGRPFPPSGVDELRIEAAAKPVIADFAQRGFAIVVVTNQPDVARGSVARDVVESINARLRDALPLDDLITCYHDGPDKCPCRKPAPGMLIDAAARLDLDLPRSYMVGDRWSDIEAGRNAGCRTVWIDRGYAERTPVDPDARVHSLTEASTWIIDDYNSR